MTGYIMVRETLDKKIRSLFDEIIVLDSMVENAILDSVKSLKNRDIDLARQVYSNDKVINAKRFELENDTIVTIATQQPLVARDLRLTASILEVVGELERIGDYAKGIAKICILLGNQTPVKPLIDIPRMAEITVDMLNRAIGAFIQADVNAAQAIPPEDDQVDDLYKQVYRELVTIMLSNPSTIDRANYLMWAAHNLERMADRVTNICERTIYVATGELMEFDITDDELTHPV
jgi:phosphate transport system protein